MESSLAALWCDLRDKFRWFSVDQLNHAAACITFPKMDPVINGLAISTKWLAGSYCYGQPILFSCRRTLFGAPLVISRFCQANRHCCQWSEKHCSYQFGVVRPFKMCVVFFHRKIFVTAFQFCVCVRSLSKYPFLFSHFLIHMIWYNSTKIMFPMQHNLSPFLL